MVSEWVFFILLFSSTIFIIKIDVQNIILVLTVIIYMNVGIINERKNYFGWTEYCIILTCRKNYVYI